jgi:hypothetical protein
MQLLMEKDMIVGRSKTTSRKMNEYYDSPYEDNRFQMMAEDLYYDRNDN